MDINPCRCCGRQPSKTVTTVFVGYYVGCFKCDIHSSTMPSHTMDEAIEKWNKLCPRGEDG